MVALLPPFPFIYPVVATRRWSPGARCHCWRLLILHWRCLLLHGVRLRGVVRRSQAGGLAFSIIATFVLAFLRQSCLSYVRTQILLLLLSRLWLSTCIRALEAPGLYYDACMTYFVLELCCDIFPWVPDLDRTHLRAWLVYGQIGGVTSWYQSRLPIWIPLPHSLSEVESSRWKLFY